MGTDGPYLQDFCGEHGEEGKVGRCRYLRRKCRLEEEFTAEGAGNEKRSSE